VGLFGGGAGRRDVPLGQVDWAGCEYRNFREGEGEGYGVPVEGGGEFGAGKADGVGGEGVGEFGVVVEEG